jgi:acyl-CoA thioester hydrolase
MAELEWAEDVRPEWIDYNGHLSEAYYVLVFGHASDAAMVALGMTPGYLVETATSLFTLEAHVRYLDQIPPGAQLSVRTSVIGVTGKLLWLWHEMRSEDRLRARAEALRVPPPEHASRRIAVG